MIAQLESDWFQAQRANDAATIDKLLSDDYIGISAQGLVSTKAQALARIQTRQVVIHKLRPTLPVWLMPLRQAAAMLRG